MNKELRELLNSINAKKQEVKDFVAENKVKEAKAAKEELKELQDKFDILSDIEDGAAGAAAAGEGEGKHNATKEEKYGKKDLVKAYANVIVAGARKKSPSDKSIEVLTYFNSMNEKPLTEDGESEGGITVPQDILTSIIELRRQGTDLTQLVNVETVTTLEGSRPIEIDADSIEWPEVDEGGNFVEGDTPKFKQVKYKIKKYGGILKITYELLKDTAENITAYLNKWIAKKSRATRNGKILAKLKEITAGKALAVNSLDDVKRIFNVMLDPAIAVTASIWTNQTGFNWLDTLKDEKGNYLLQPDPTDETKRVFAKVHPVTVISDKVLKNEETKVPMYFGDFKEAITLFDREAMTITTSDQADGVWENDKIGIKVRDRFDVRAVDEKAVIRGELTIPSVG